MGKIAVAWPTPHAWPRQRRLLLTQVVGVCDNTGNYAEAIRDMEAIAGRKDVALPAIVALQQFHQQAAMVDDAALEDLAGRESAAEGTASEDGLLMTARFYWHWRIGSVSKARKYIQKILKTSPDNPRALSLQGLIALSVGSSNRRDAEAFDASIGWFEQVIAQRYVDAFELRCADQVSPGTVDQRQARIGSLDWRRTVLGSQTRLRESP